MIRHKMSVIVAASALLATAEGSAAMELPSGTAVALHEVLVEQIGDETWVRFRFLAPEIDRSRADAPEFADLEPDFPHLCATVVLPYLETHVLRAESVVISVADRVVEFGTSDPDATQYFEQFRIEDGTCVWENF